MNPLELRQLIKHKQNEAYEAAALVAKSYNGETAALELADEIRDLKHKDA